MKKLSKEQVDIVVASLGLEESEEKKLLKRWQEEGLIEKEPSALDKANRLIDNLDHAWSAQAREIFDAFREAIKEEQERAIKFAYQNFQSTYPDIDEDDLKDRGADDDIGGHPQQIDQRRHHDETAANTEKRGEQSDDAANDQGRNGADIEARAREAHLEWQAVNPIMLA